MSKFLSLVEQFDPQNTEDPKWELIDFLKSKGVHVRLDKLSGRIMIDTGSREIAVSVSSIDNEEEAESINSDQELKTIASSGGPVAPRALGVIRRKKTLAPNFVKNEEDKLKEMEKMLNKPKAPIIR